MFSFGLSLNCYFSFKIVPIKIHVAKLYKENKA